ncbi:ester cyclase [Variovorax sp. OV329]|uniref:ester cyclase n=1 Tax=Variovorax sp. OV329 TaxID=1882825 RepID=UPI000B890F8F|nr:ester cyclase [Variovorax sp. OV329]
MSNSNREIVVSFFNQVWEAGDEAAIDRLMAQTAKIHGLPSPDGGPIFGPTAFKPFVRQFRQAFPDLKIRALHIVCEGNLVVYHCNVTGTHLGPDLGVSPSGSKFEMEGVVIAAIEGGQIQEGWNCFDFMSLYQQIGMLPLLSGG